MDNLVRLESMIIEGVKNVGYGELSFDELSKIKQDGLNNLNSVLGIYGQNGSGKTTALETAKILKRVLSGEKLPEDIEQYISNESHRAKIECTFYIKLRSLEQLITYTFVIAQLQEKNDTIYDIVYEKMVSKEYLHSEGKWLSINTLFEVENNEITLKKLLNKLSNDNYIGLKVAKEIEVGSSFFFNTRNLSHVVSGLKDKNEEKLIEVLKILNIYAQTSLIIIENDLMGSIGLNTRMPVNVYLSDQNSLKLGRVAINLLKPSELREEIFIDFEKVITQIDTVLNAIVPTLNIEIKNKKEQTMKDGSNGYGFEVVSKRNGKPIPLRYESEGIKRIISVTSSLIAMYNNPSICLMIDEFDSGIFEYLLGELIEIIYESAKGQFVFTSHNLRVLEKLPYKSIILTTVNPKNRYIRFSGVKPNNNVRDFYYTGIMLGGQKEILYNETKNYKIKKAFRKAGKMYE